MVNIIFSVISHQSFLCSSTWTIFLGLSSSSLALTIGFCSSPSWFQSLISSIFHCLAWFFFFFFKLVSHDFSLWINTSDLHIILPLSVFCLWSFNDFRFTDIIFHPFFIFPYFFIQSKVFSWLIFLWIHLYFSLPQAQTSQNFTY